MFDLVSLAGVDSRDDEASLTARIAELERVKSAAAAGQARAAAALDKLRRCNEADAGVPARRRGRGVASEVALARRDSPARGGRHLGFAKALVYEMPHTLAALEVGRLSEWRATLIVRESACLDVEDRRALDAELCADMSALDGMGDARIAAAARAIAYRLDAQAVVERAARAETERTVTIRPAPDTMTWVTALLPVARGVSVYAALKRAADTTFDDRTRGQVMADTLVERVTGQPAEAAQPVAVNLVLSDETLLAGDRAPAVVDGYGPIPAAVARNLVRDAVADTRSRATLRRLYRHPRSGPWWRWNRGHAGSRRGWPRSSGCAISAVACPTAMPRSATVTTPSRIIEAARPPRPTASDRVNAVTTSRKLPAGASAPTRTKPAVTQLNSPRPPGCTITAPRHHCPGRWR
ncbi:hypothetical protein RN11_1633 [Mycobacterium tuberculosis]|nr:hypothetical protein RN11_1633 [Mycobacterium tuberculosis]